MTWSYSGNPDDNDKDAIRFLVGDVVSAEPLITDEEIDFQVNRWFDKYGTLEYVASKVCDALAARFAREAAYSADGTSISLNMLQKQYADQAANLRQQHKDLLVGGLPDAGGITAGEEPDPAIAELNFGTGMHDNFEGGQQEYGRRHPRTYTPETDPGV